MQTIEKRQGIKLECPEEAALIRGFLSLPKVEALLAQMPECEYQEHLQHVCAEFRRQRT